MKTSLRIYLLLSLFAIATALTGYYRHTGDVTFSQLEWDFPLVVLAGFIGVLLSKRVELPQMLDESVSNKDRFWFPMLIGVGYAVLDVATYAFLLHPEPHETLPPFVQPFPWSIFHFGAAAVFMETLYRLLPITLLVGLATLIFGKKALNPAFWIVAILISGVEPWLQKIEVSTGWLWFSLINGYSYNLLQVYFLKRGGYLATLTIRGSHYMIWHVAYGIWIQYAEAT